MASSEEGSSFQTSAKEKLTSIKNFTATSWTRARQYTIEKLGKAEVTEYDSEYQSLCTEMDAIKQNSEKMIHYVVQLLEPDPALRLEGLVYKKLDRPQRQTTSPQEMLGLEMTRAGKEFGPETQYGGYLLRCGEVEYKMAQTKRRYREKVERDFLTPLRAFLEVDIKNAVSERKAVSIKRLDLDAAKKRATDAKPEKLPAAEDELRRAQAEFDAQLEKARTTLKRVNSSHVNHLGHLRSLIVAQKSFHNDCLEHLAEVDVAASGQSVSEPEKVPLFKEEQLFEFMGMQFNKSEGRNGRVLYDYDAPGEDQIAVEAGQEVLVLRIPDNDQEFIVLVKQGISEEIGKVPVTHIEF